MEKVKKSDRDLVKDSGRDLEILSRDNHVTQYEI